MLTDECPEANNEEAIERHLNVELIINLGTNNEQCGHVAKRSR